MPELPEVETVRRGLAAAIANARITEVTIRRRDLRRPVPEDFEARLNGRRLTDIGRRAKYLLLNLDSGDTAILHLGMSGRITIEAVGRNAPPGPHDHARIAFDGGQAITFNDARRFGIMTVARTGDLASHPLLAGLGPEPLGEAFSTAYIRARARGSRQPLKAFLLDQRVVAGVGNIYAAEALHRARLSPRRKAGTLGKTRADRLVEAVHEVLTEAIEAGGSTLRDYVQTNGELGYFQHRFRVYEREGAPCPRAACGGSVQRIVQSGRSTYFCSACQR